MSLRSGYDFVLPRGYVDQRGELHRTGTMRLATARDELEPLRDPMVSGPDDPRLTILVLARVVTVLGTVELINSSVIEDLFAADLAFLQDFYGVINFGSQAEYEALLRAQQETPEPPTPISPTAPLGARVAAPPAAAAAAAETEAAAAPPDFDGGDATDDGAAAAEAAPPLPAVTSTIERFSSGSVPRRSAIEEIPAGGR